MRYKKYEINLSIITQSNVLPDIQDIRSGVPEDNEGLKKETLPDGIVLFRAPWPHEQLVYMYIPETHLMFNFDLGVTTCGLCYYKYASTRDIERYGDLRDLIFRHVLHPFFNSIPKKSFFSRFKK